MMNSPFANSQNSSKTCLHQQIPASFNWPIAFAIHLTLTLVKRQRFSVTLMPIKPTSCSIDSTLLKWSIHQLWNPSTVHQQIPVPTNQATFTKGWTQHPSNMPFCVTIMSLPIKQATITIHRIPTLLKRAISYFHNIKMVTIRQCILNK